MTNRLYTPEKSPQFGLVGWLEQTRVQLPLKGVECRFYVGGDLLNVEIDQLFHQNNPQAMDCLYTFPLPAGAAVYRCEMHVNGRVIRARVEEQQRAREIAREQKAAGRRTALVEMERENLFTLSLGNLQPGDLVVIRFAYFQTLTRLADWTSLRIPFCPGIRYIPGQPLLRSLRGKGVVDDTDQVPDASRISPPRIDALHPDAAYLSVQGVIENLCSAGSVVPGSAGILPAQNPPGLVSDISSPSHPVLVHDGDGRWTVTLAQQGAVPDCDFALRWTEVRGEQLRSAAWALRDGAETYALVLFQAPRVPVPVHGAAQDFYFLVDRSGSMAGLKWEKAVQSFRAFLSHLGPEDRAWVTFFDDQWRDFAEKPLTARDLAADTSLSSLESLGAAGGTELLPALQHVLEVTRQHSAGREAALILITDGQVGNEQPILASLRAHPGVRLHTFGIDTAVNDALLTRLAAQQRGSSCLLQPTDDIVGAVTRLSPRLRSPVLTSIAVCNGWELPGATVPDLHSEECLSLSLKINSADAKEVFLRGTLPLAAARGEGGSREETFRFPLTERAEPAIRLLWASNRIRHLQNQNQYAEAIALAKQHNLLCEGAAFIAWDEGEQVPIAQRELYQPVLKQHFSAPVVFKKHFLADLKTIDLGARLMVREAGPAKQPGSYRHDIMYAMSPLVEADRRLTALLSTRSDVDGDQFRRQFARKLGEWYQRFTESFAFHGLVTDRALIDLLMEWVVEGDADAPRRMAGLEELIWELEWKAPDPESGLAITRRWAEQAMLAGDEYRTRTLAVLDGLAQNLVEIRERERKEGKRVLLP